MSTETPTKSTHNGETKRFLSFSLGAEQYAVPLLTVREVVARPETTRVPHTPSHFLGIMNLRGQVISVFDMRLKFNLKAENGPETAVIICDLAPLCFGIVVNSVDSVLNLTDADINEKPDIESNHKSDYIMGVTRKDSKLILLVDIAKALNVQDLSVIKSVA